MFLNKRKVILLISISSLIFLLIFNQLESQELRVIDGDTVAFRSDFLPAPLKPELSIRIYGVDTPEKGYRAECESEAKQGKKASDFTKALVKNAKSTKIVIMKWDKYGGRILGDVILDGKSLTKQLLEKGFARKYCGGQKESWCK